MITIVLDLDLNTEARARARGLLTPEAIRAWVESELERDERALSAEERQREAAWMQVFQSIDAVQAGAAAKYAHLSEEDVMDMVNEEIHAMRAEKRTQQDQA